MSERRYLLVKRGLYYAPNNQGYTGVKAFAGRYREVDALGLDSVTAIHEDDAPMFSKACWEHVKVSYLQAEIAKRDAVIDGLLGAATDAIEIITDSWGEDAMERGDCQAVNRLRAAIDSAKGECSVNVR